MSLLRRKNTLNHSDTHVHLHSSAHFYGNVKSQPNANVDSDRDTMACSEREEARHHAEELIRNNANCTLPCWWGIVPGKTSWSPAQSLLYQFDQKIYERTADRSEPFKAEALIPVRKEIFSIGRLSHIYTIDHGIVQMIDVYPGEVPEYNLASVMTKYGKPEEIWVYAEAKSPKSGVPL